MSSSTKSSLSSLHWAIKELSKQKNELSSKLSVAQKREDTSSLIQEVHAQKEALVTRISSLEEGYKTSFDLVDEPIVYLEEELHTINDKLEIAQDRLNTLEQEEYLEELGRKLNGDFKEGESMHSIENKKLNENQNDPSLASQNLTSGSSSEDTELASSSLQPLQSPTPVLMKSPTNRIETEEAVEDSASRVPPAAIVSDQSKFEQCSPVTEKSLEECANALGMEPEYLLNKGMQAVLRMISRNGNKVSFPLEVEQVEKT
jgi:hypothetical protein